MKAIITGANGQLAKDLIENAPKNVKLIPLSKQELDITDMEKLDETLKQASADIVINTAAFVNVDLCESQPEKAFLVNSVGVKNLVEASKRAGAILLQVSTDYVFDGGKLKDKEPYKEEDIPNPINVYGVSKYAGELVVRNYLNKYYIVRVASLYGRAGSKSKGGNFVYTVLNKAKRGEPLKVVNDIYMSPTYAKDAAVKIWELLINRREFGTYHITNSGYCSWYEFAVKILDYAGIKADAIPISHRDFPRKAKIPLWTPLESGKGISTRRWEEALKEFINSL